jgi:hypothetical protein
MSTTRKIACTAAAFLLIAAPALSQVTRTSGDQLVSWVDISAAPSFPVPLFRGNQTKFRKANAGAALAQKMNDYSKQMTLMTRDSMLNVYQWYTSYLPSSGYKVDDRSSKLLPGGRIYLVKADSTKVQATITISAMNDANGPATQIVITVKNQPAASAKI